MLYAKSKTYLVVEQLRASCVGSAVMEIIVTISTNISGVQGECMSPVQSAHENWNVSARAEINLRLLASAGTGISDLQLQALGR